MTVERTHPWPEPAGDEPDAVDPAAVAADEVLDPAADEVLDPALDDEPDAPDGRWSDRASRLGCLAVVVGAVALALLGAYAELRAVL